MMLCGFPMALGRWHGRSHQGPPHHCPCTSLPLEPPRQWGELTKTSLAWAGVPTTAPSGGLNQGCTDPAETLGTDRAGGARLLCTVCPCGGDTWGDAQMDSHRPPENPPQSTGMFTLINTQQSQPAIGPRRSSRRKPPTTSLQAWSCPLPQFPLLPNAHLACVNENCRPAGGGPAQIKPSPWENKCVYLKCVSSIPGQTVRAGNLSCAVTGWLSPSPGLFRE